MPSRTPSFGDAVTGLARDLLHGCRAAIAHPAVHLVGILTLGVSIAAVTTMFSVVDAVLLQPLPYRDAARLALVWDRTGDSTRDIWLSPPEFADVRERTRTLSDLAALTDRRFTLTGRGEAEELQAVAVSPGFFAMLDVRPAAGRLLDARDERPGTRTVVIGDATAERLFGSPGAAVGRPLVLDAEAWTVIGVLPRGFVFWPPSTVFPRHVDAWIPIDADAYVRSGRNLNVLHALVRLRDGVAMRAAEADLQRVSDGIERDQAGFYAGKRWHLAMTPLASHLVGPVRPAITILFAAVGLLLLIACANVGSLLVARAAARSEELAVRAALGAGRLRLCRQLLAESAIVGVPGAVVGVLLSLWTVAWIGRAGPLDVPRLDAAAVDVRVLLFSGGIALASTLLFGAAPVLQVLADERAGRLRAGARGATSSLESRRLRRVFATAQVALAVVLMVGAGLLLKSFVRLGRVETGFTAGDVATARIHLPASRYPAAAERSAFFAELTDRLARRGDVAAAAAVTQLPMSGAFLASTFAVPPGDRRGADVELGADLRGVTPGYFETLRIRLEEGRAFSAGDTRDAPPVAVVDATFARRFWPAGGAVGHRIRWVRTGDLLEIVGVVSAIRHYGNAAPPRETVYRPYAQYAAIPEMFVEVRAAHGDDEARAAIVQEVHGLDPDQPVADQRRMDSLVEASLGQPRFNTTVLAMFSAIAVLLSAVGIYSIVSFDVVERRHEISVRLAVGADTRSIVRLIVADGARMALAGVGAGSVLALVAAGALRPLVYGLDPFDPAVFSAAIVLASAVVLAASAIPAARAGGNDPVAVLKM
jgi:putative ABC transport system permease protein